MLKLLSIVTLSLAVAGAAAAQPSTGRLHDALNLAPGQEPTWRAYQAAIAQDPQQRARAEQAQMLMPTLPTPRRLALIRAQMQSDQQVFDQNAQAVLAFYATLSPEQQRVFDRETAAPAQGQGPGPGPGPGPGQQER
jgi:LTXXQ motif family protein